MAARLRTIVVVCRIKQVFLRTLMLLSYLSLSACLSNKYAPHLTAPIEANADAGIIILSVGAPDWCNAGTSLLLHRHDRSYNAVPKAVLFVDTWMLESDFPTHYGHLYVVKLPPNKYYLSPHLHTIGGYTELPKADFEVYANEVVYLGQFFMPKSCSFHNLLGFQDNEARDLAMLKAKNPAFEQVMVTKRLLRWTGEAERAMSPFRRELFPLLSEP